MDINHNLRKIKEVTIRDILSLWPMIIAAILIPLYKRRFCETWSICERRDEARDNGYWFYVYMKKNHPDIECIYVIDKNCDDYNRVKDYGDTVGYGTIKHWVLYFCSKYLISSQSFKPNGVICVAIERLKIFNPKHVFLQHGITINKPDYLHAKRRPVHLFIAGAKPEADFLKDNFGFSKDVIRYTGFPRFDNLHDFATDCHQVLIMPTWRKWLTQKTEMHSEINSDIYESDYFLRWKELLHDPVFMQLIKEYELDVLFYPHPNLKKYGITNRIINDKIINAEEQNIEDLLKNSAMIITDYSSVFFDMVYMKKPVVFFQFDEEHYRNYHYEEGWFDYGKTSFGEKCSNKDEVIEAMKNLCQNSFRVEESFLDEHKRTFPIYDQCNSERVYSILKN